MGQSVHVFADSNDGGRDGAFYGSWKSAPAYVDGLQDGPFVVQCKHTTQADKTLALSDIKDELDKVAALVSKGMCSSYILVTNARVTGNADAKIREALGQRGVKFPLVLNGAWINQTIAKHRALRMFVPRVYGLGDLSHILDERAYAQAEALLAYLKDDLATFVITDAYKRAAQAVRDNGFVLLLGEPAAGKSLIAATLAMAALDSWGCVTIKADTPAEAIAHWNPHEPNQFIWVDDAFGALRHERDLTDEWARRLPKVMTAIRRGAKVVLTSRDYIYRDARNFLKEYAYPLLREQQVVVDVTELTGEERRQILYNHIRRGNQPVEVRRALKINLDAAADVKPFRPEVARRLGHQEFTGGLSWAPSEIINFMKHPMSFLKDVYGGLEAAHKAALTLVQSAGVLPSPLSVNNPTVQSVLNSFGVTESAVSIALNSLDGTFLRLSVVPGQQKDRGWSFRHPTLREGFAAYIDEDVHRVSILLSGLSDHALLEQIDCGSGDDRGTLVVIPPALYHQVAERLVSSRPSLVTRFEDRQRWNQFFVHRCSLDFLRICVDVDPNFIESFIKFGSYLEAVEQPKVLARLHEAGLLDQTHRERIISTLRSLAIETPDSAWLDLQEWMTLTTIDERSWLMQEVRRELVPKLDDCLEDWFTNEPDDEHPTYYYERLESALRRYRRELLHDAEAVDLIDYALEDAARACDSAAEIYVDPDEAETESEQSSFYPSSGARGGSGVAGEGRSIFDDLDS